MVTEVLFFLHKAAMAANLFMQRFETLCLSNSWEGRFEASLIGY